MTDPGSGAQFDAEATVADDADEHFKRSANRLVIVRGYVLIVIGVGLIIWSFIPPVKPATLTLGGAILGFNPIIRATVK